uniref:Uncharacterized protein n=1 Tax=Solanum tuberosum TaxID=4113 RepID=M1DVT4_SOLTU
MGIREESIINEDSVVGHDKHHQPRIGGPRYLSRAVDHHTDRTSARGNEEKPPQAQSSDHGAFIGRGLDDGQWEGPWNLSH